MNEIRRAAALLAVVLGCSKPVSHPPLAGLRIVYELDLDRAVDDRIADVQRDLTAALADAKLDATIRTPAMRAGTLVVTPAELAKRPSLLELVQQSYRGEAGAVDCAPDDPLGAVCIQLSAQYVATVRNAALERAVTTIRTRIDQLRVTDPVVVARGEQIVVEVSGDPASPELLAVRNLAARGGNLEMKVVDDCTMAPATGCVRGGDHAGSPFMKRLFAHVNGDADAQRAGIHADVDSWRGEEDSATHTDYYLQAPDRAVLERYLADLARRDPTFRVPDDHLIGYELVAVTGEPAHWRTYYLERATRISGRDLAGASANTDPNTNRPMVTLEFGRSGGQRFGDLTAEITGMKLATLLDGVVKSAPIINGAIRGGRAMIAMGDAPAAAQEHDRDELVAALKSGALPAPLREISVTKIGPGSAAP